MRKYIITAELRDLEWKVSKGEISYSRMIEILCEKADEYAKMYHEQELSKLHQPTVISAVCNSPCCKEQGIFELPLGSEWYCKEHYKQTDL